MVVWLWFIACVAWACTLPTESEGYDLSAAKVVQSGTRSVITGVTCADGFSGDAVAECDEERFVFSGCVRRLADPSSVGVILSSSLAMVDADAATASKAQRALTTVLALTEDSQLQATANSTLLRFSITTSVASLGKVQQAVGRLTPVLVNAAFADVGAEGTVTGKPSFPTIRAADQDYEETQTCTGDLDALAGNCTSRPGHYAFAGGQEAECLISGVCLGNNTCLVGHRGVLCNSCTPGFTQQASGNRCKICPTPTWNAISIVLFLVLFGVVISLYVQITLEGARQPKKVHSVAIKIVLNYLALTSAAVQVVDVNRFMPGWFQGAPDAVQSTQQPLRAYLSLGCLVADLLPSLPYYSFSVMLHLVLVPVVPLGMFAFRWARAWWVYYRAVRHERRRERRGSPRRKQRQAPDLMKLLRDLTPETLVIVFTLHTYVTEAFVHALRCVEIPEMAEYGGVLRFAGRLDLACDEDPMQVHRRTLAFIGLGVWSLGVPCAIYAVLQSHGRDIYTEENRIRFGFFTNGYDPDHFCWECYQMVRKVAILSVFIFSSFNQRRRALWSFMLGVCFMFMQWGCLPFDNRQFAALDSMERKAILAFMSTIFGEVWLATGSDLTSAWYEEMETAAVLLVMAWYHCNFVIFACRVILCSFAGIPLRVSEIGPSAMPVRVFWPSKAADKDGCVRLLDKEATLDLKSLNPAERHYLAKMLGDACRALVKKPDATDFRLTELRNVILRIFAEHSMSFDPSKVENEDGLAEWATAKLLWVLGLLQKCIWAKSLWPWHGQVAPQDFGGDEDDGEVPAPAPQTRQNYERKLWTRLDEDLDLLWYSLAMDTVALSILDVQEKLLGQQQVQRGRKFGVEGVGD